jgi:hypothetical protein
MVHPNIKNPLLAEGLKFYRGYMFPFSLEDESFEPPSFVVVVGS